MVQATLLPLLFPTYWVSEDVPAHDLASRLRWLMACLLSWSVLVTRLLLLSLEERQEGHARHLHHLSRKRKLPCQIHSISRLECESLQITARHWTGPRCYRDAGSAQKAAPQASGPSSQPINSSPCLHRVQRRLSVQGLPSQPLQHIQQT